MSLTGGLRLSTWSMVGRQGVTLVSLDLEMLRNLRDEGQGQLWGMELYAFRLMSR